MTVFNVKLGTKSGPVKSILKNDPELGKIVDEWGKALGAQKNMFKKHGAQVVKISRNVYKAADDRLKQAKKNEICKKDVEALTSLRKQAYDLTTSVKEHLRPY